MDSIATVVAGPEAGNAVKAAGLLNLGPSAVLKHLAKTETALATPFSKTSRLPFGMQNRHLRFREGGMWNMALLSR